ncbi:acyl-coenzyme A thioesterase 9, mitochondrial-like [Branchiostoma floridae]|uniref:Acyl-coenzyme A thioesterase 9, mitochondrial-like n=1 Tax=Branchiostoma floridae TaxID=7739 RepID=A0A9J7N788_BRAFL|nr:acyl-coenzyme A thioesterase 9, mitochondrial-like [Branchiostoma floridae]
MASRRLLSLFRQAGVQSRFVLVRHESSATLPSIQEVRSRLQDLVGAQKFWSVEAEDRSKLATQLPSSQDELTPRRSAESRQQVVIPLATNEPLREKYINFFKGIRFGRILEDLDTFAVWISYQHNKGEGEKSPLSIVTALVDRIVMHEQFIHPDCDIRMTGNVTWTGKTSMEVTMQLEQQQQLFSPCSSAFVHPVVPETEDDKALFQLGESHKIQRKEQTLQSLFRQPPTAEERQYIHDIFLSTLNQKSVSFRDRVKPDNSRWLDETILKNIIICHPENRNLYSKMFGGFLMRQAFELGWSNACLYCKSRPFIEAVDDIMFRGPVEVGSLLFMSSEVVYTRDQYLQVRVHAEVVDPKTGEHETTNIFHFTFSSPLPFPKVLPKTYAESMLYLSGKRHFESAVGKA